MDEEISQILGALSATDGGSASAAAPAAPASVPDILTAPTPAADATLTLPPRADSVFPVVPAHPPFAPAPAVPANAGRSWEWCDDCGVATEDSSDSQQETICRRCSQVFARPTAEETAVLGCTSSTPAVRQAPPLTMVGEESARYQKVLDRVSVTDPDDAASAEIYRELLRYNHEFTAGPKFSEAVLRDVADVYARRVRKAGTSRAQFKQGMLAKLVFTKCLEAKEPRVAEDCAMLLQLRHKGLARGESRMRMMNVCSDLLDTDAVMPWVDDTFNKMGLRPDGLSPPSQALTPSGSLVSSADRALLATLREAAASLLAAGEKAHLGINQKELTRAVCAVYVVVRRAARAGRLPAAWDIAGDQFVPAGCRGSLEWVSAQCAIRVQTIKNHLRVLEEYHSQFLPVYKRYALWEGPI